MTAVMLVEDHNFLRKTLAAFLESAGFEVRAMFATAEEALEQLSHIKVDIVLVDISLPGMNGIELVGRIRKKYPSLPCIMLSSHRTATFVRMALVQGASGYVTKDKPEDVLEGLEAVLGGKMYLSQDVRE